MRRALVVAIAVMGVLAPVASANEGLRVRKSVTALTTQERADFVNAVLALKATPSPYDETLSYYDQFVQWHVYLTRCNDLDPLMQNRIRGHNGPMFLPWHRQFVVMLEDALGEAAGKPIAVPYWDWTKFSSTASVFANDFMGGDGDPADKYAVTSGPFRKGQWELKVQGQGPIYGQYPRDHLTRRRRAGSLPTAAEVTEALGVPAYDVEPYDDRSDRTRSFRNAVEGFTKEPATPMWESGCVPGTSSAGTIPRGAGRMHNFVHDWVGGQIEDNDPLGASGGTMKNPQISPSDPVFFLHHAQIDRLWAKWQETHGEDTYLPKSGLPYNSETDLMEPFDADGIDVTPADVASTRQLGYVYDDSAPLSRAAGGGVPGWRLSCRL